MAFDLKFERDSRKNMVSFFAFGGKSPQCMRGRVSDLEIGVSSFSTKIQDFNGNQVRIHASGIAADICAKVVRSGRTYFFSGVEKDKQGEIHIGMMSEIVEFLDSMRRNRIIHNEEAFLDLKEERFYVKAKIVGISTTIAESIYRGCNNPQCYGAKATEMKNGDGEVVFRCHKCENEGTDFDWKLKLEVKLIDDSVEEGVIIFAGCFKEAAETLLGEKEGFMGQLAGNKDNATFSSICGKAVGKTIVARIRAGLYDGDMSFTIADVFP